MFVTVKFRYLSFDCLRTDQTCLISIEIVIWTIEIDNKIFLQFKRLFQVPNSHRFLISLGLRLADLVELSFLKFLKTYISKGIVTMLKFSLEKDIKLIDT